MSANLDLVRSLYEAWERGDYSSSEWAHPEIEWVIADGPDPGTWVGVSGMAEGFRSSMGVWNDVRAAVEEYRELDGERVLVLEWRRARGKASGLELRNMRSEGAVLFCVRDGTVARLVFYWDRDRALADLGLKGSAVSRNAAQMRQGTDAFNAFMRGELSSEAYAERFDPQIEMIWRDRQTYPDFPQHVRGLPEFIAFAEQYRDGWIDLVQELVELIEVPGGRVLVLVRQSGRGRQNRVPIVVHFFELCTIRDGKVGRIEYFRHRADALQAAGLAE